MDGVTTSEAERDADVPMAPRRALRRRWLILGAGAVAFVLVAGVAVAARPGPSLGPGLACAEVAALVGLTFTGDYGPAIPAPGANSEMWQQNLGNGAAVGDYDLDGDLDVLLLGQAGHHSKLFRNDEASGDARTFTDVTEAAGLGAVTSNGRVAQFVDLNGRGRPDIVIAADYRDGGPGGPSQIFRNDGDGTFTDVTAGSGFEPAGFVVGGMTFADYDGSGRPSIWISYWTSEAAGDPGRNVIQGTFPGTNRLYRNLGDYRFEDVTDSIGFSPYHADSFTAVFADFTGDHRPDIYQANDHRFDRFYENLGDGRFLDRGASAGLGRAGNSMGVATSVGTGGWLQLYVTQITDPTGLFGSNLGNTYVLSEMGPDGIRFSNVAAEYGILDTAWGWGAAFVDMDLDGDQDLYAVQGMRAHVGDESPHLANATSKLFLDDGTGTAFASAPDSGCEVPGDQRALVVFDYNRDGAPDLLITQVAGPTMLLQNYRREAHWLTVAPDGPADAGINARITVTAGGRSTTQIVLAGGSYLAGPPREAYFGLGETPTAERVRVEWADGTATELQDVPADQVLRVTR